MSETRFERLGPYRLLNVVNAGQSSRLWQAYNDETREYVALKTLLDKFARNKSQIDILRWEYEVSSKLSDPLLIAIREFGIDRSSKTPYLAMEWFPAPNIKMLINRGYAEYASHMEYILSGMLGSLMYLHEQGWVHRDIKPDNFLFHPEQGFKLIDFALAKRLPSGIGKIFAMKLKTQGTASYMSPEQIRGQAPDVRSDIYSLGCTFFELLTTKLPYSANSMNELLQKHIGGPIPSITARNKNLTPEVGNLMKLMLAKKADDRPKSIKELVGMLGGIRLFKKEPSGEDII